MNFRLIPLADNDLNSRELVKSASRSLDVLEYLAEHPGGASLTAIKENLNIPASSLYNLIMTLVSKGYIARNEVTLHYRLGPMVGQLASSYFDQLDLIQIADPFMSQLAQLTGESCSLTILRGAEIVFVHKVVGEGVIQIVNPVGTTLAAHATGSGKVMLAHLPAEEIDWVYPEEELPRFTPNTITNKTALKNLLPEIASQGYSFDDEESNEGIWAVASCIQDRRGRPAGALSVVGLAGRIHQEDKHLWPQYVRQMASKISLALGYRSQHAPDDTSGFFV
jgi:DNA-binding IclR family transcriptional regulator